MARSLNGTSDVISMGAASALNTAAVTVSIWVKPSSLANAYSGIFSRNQTADTAGVYNLYLKSSGQLAVYINGSGGAVSYDPGSHTLSTGTVYHLAFSYDSTNGIVGYVNGASDGIAAANGILLNQTGPFTNRIGNDAQVASRFLGGSVAEAGIWSTNLVQSEITTLSSGALPYTVRPAALVGYWPLYGLSSPEPDLSGNANNGTLTGTALAAGPPVMQFTPRWPQTPPPPLFYTIRKQVKLNILQTGP